jgi:putative transposase
VHVTLRTRFKSLRQQAVFDAVWHTIADANARAGGRFRIVHFSVQTSHIHLIVEARSRAALIRGVRGLSVSLTRRINPLVLARGRLFADRWHGRALTSPREVRNALVYLFGNFRKDGERAQGDLDPRSSAPYFSGFSEYQGGRPVDLDASLVPPAFRALGAPVLPPESWLLRSGWLRHGRLSVHEVPKVDPAGS